MDVNLFFRALSEFWPCFDKQREKEIKGAELDQALLSP